MKKIIKCEDIEFQIYIEDTDFQGVVYHSNYLKYFERSRSEFLSFANISQSFTSSPNWRWDGHERRNTGRTNG